MPLAEKLPIGNAPFLVMEPRRVRSKLRPAGYEVGSLSCRHGKGCDWWVAESQLSIDAWRIVDIPISAVWIANARSCCLGSLLSALFVERTDNDGMDRHS